MKSISASKHKHEIAEMNSLRQILRQAMNDIKVKEWSTSKLIAKSAEEIWKALNIQLKSLGDFQ
jgi:hypothetical protein